MRDSSLPGSGTLPSGETSVMSDLLDFPQNHPRQIAGYRLVDLLGEGGMGTVYLAEQVEPLPRLVALKLIRPTRLDQQAIHRFEAERSALARLNHPNVAQVYEAGDTELGQPYLVMEHVPGEPITHYCNQKRLDIRQRLQLMLEVCSGIQHAHQKGIIHRDLTPRNILVAEIEGKPVVKIIDFGIAKALDQPLTDATVTSTHSGMIGTPSYLSPEAIEGSDQDLDLDTRCDVYALGLLLYELLVGELPFGGGKEHFLKTLRKIVAEEPDPPSRRFLAMAPELREERCAERGGVSEAVLQRMLGRELDWIVLEAIARDREERYPSASALAADLRRFLSDRPVRAARPNPFYRARKFVRRHRPALLAATLVLVVVVWGVVGRLQEAERANREAERANRQAEAALAASREADGVVRFLVELFEISDLRDTAGETVTARTLLDRGAEKIDNFSAEPVPQARLMETVGVVYRKLGLYDEAAPLLEGALELREEHLGEEHPTVASSLEDLAQLRFQEGKFREAEPLARRSLEIREKILGADHAETATSLNLLADTYRRQGRHDLAEPLLLRSLPIHEKALGAVHPKVAETLNSLAILYWNQSRYQESAPLFRRALEIWERSLGPDHPEVAATLSNLAGVYRDLGAYDRSEPLYRRTLALRETSLGSDHPAVGYSLCNLAVLLRRQERYTEAEFLYLRALEIWEGSLGTEHPEIAFLLNNLALLHLDQELPERARVAVERALAVNRRAFGEKHSSVASSLNIRALVAAAEDDPETAEALHRRALELYEDFYSPDHGRVAWPLHGLGNLLRDQGRVDEAVAVYRRALRIRQVSLGKNHPDTLSLRADLEALERP